MARFVTLCMWQPWRTSGGKQRCAAASHRYNHDMRFVVAALMCFVAIGCSAPGSQTGAPPAGLALSADFAGAEAGSPTEVDFETLDEVALRTEISAGGDALQSRLALVTLLEQQERHHEALELLRSSTGAGDSALELELATASVLRDLGRRREAMEVLLRAIDRDPSRCGPGLRLEAAELCCLCGEQALGLSVCRDLERSIEGADYAKAHADEVHRVRSALLLPGGPRFMKARDLLGDLRGGEVAAVREEALRRLLELGEVLATQACGIAAADRDPGIRTLVVARATVPHEKRIDFCAAALVDPDPSVRAAGATRALALQPLEIAALLLPALGAESSPMAFAKMDAVLCWAFSLSNPTSEAMASQDEARTRVVIARRREIQP